MTTDEAVQHFGSIEAMADALGITRAAVYLWKGKVPRLREFEINQIVSERGEHESVSADQQG